MKYISPQKVLKRSILTAAMSIGSTATASRKNVQGGHGAFVHFIERDVAKVPWNDRIENFDIKALVDAMDAGGAKFFLFTLTHWDFNLPFPLPSNASSNMRNLFAGEGRTADRDLMDDLYEELNARGIKMYFYFNPIADGESAQFVEDWGYPNGDWVENVYELVELISREYGTKVEGWWIENMSHTAKGGRPAQIDRPTLARSIRAGNPDALIAYNVGGSSTVKYNLQAMRHLKGL